jgi:phosphate transport system substrate-binding protein
MNPNSHRKSFALLSSLILAALLLSACAQATPAPTTAPVEPVATEAPVEPVVTEAPAEPVAGVMLPAVDPTSVDGAIVTAGSSTVYPLSEAMVASFKDEGFPGDITVDSIGSGGGFERFCVTAETDIANASRAIKDEEVEACRSNGREPIEFRVGTDALAIVVSAENDFVDDVTLAELALIFSTASTWADVRPEWPAEPIQRFSPGTDSGTFDYFVEEVMGEDEAPILNAANIQLSEDDNVLVQGVEGSPYAIAYFGFAYYQENAGALKALSIDGVTPTAESAEDGSYPLARPLFIYSDAGIMESKPQVAAFINFYLTTVNDLIVDVGYFPASVEALDGARQAWLDGMGQ